MSEITVMVINDPSKMDLLTTAMKKQIITAAVNTVNIQAALTRKNAIQKVQKNFIIRNNFTTRQIQFTPMKHGQVHTLQNVQSSVGATARADYLRRQEEGGSHTSPSGRLSIPTDTARSGSIKNPVSNMYRLSNLRGQKTEGPIKNRLAKLSKKSSQVARAAVAHKTGKLIQYGGNLHKVISFSAGGSVSFRLKQIYSFKFSSTMTKPSPWLQPSAEKPAADGQSIFNKAMDKAARKT